MFWDFELGQGIVLYLQLCRYQLHLLLEPAICVVDEKEGEKDISTGDHILDFLICYSCMIVGEKIY